MKKLIFTILITTLSYSGIQGQENASVKDVSSKTDLNYIFSRMDVTKIDMQSLYNNGMFVKTFTISDSKITPANYSEETEEFLESIYVSITPDGDGYTSSKLFKLEGLVFPKIISISESGYPNISVKIEQGNAKNRTTTVFSINGGIQ